MINKKYTVIILKEARKDILKLDRSVSIQVAKQLTALETNPYKGNLLRHPLAGLRKLYVDKKKFRIVYRVIENIISIEVIAIAKRDKSTVYNIAKKRI